MTKVSSLKIITVLEPVAQSQRKPLLIIAEDVDGAYQH
jgi:hypothetical protein